MKTISVLFTVLATLLALISIARAQEGIMPGEPDPNTSPRTDRSEEALIDDRVKCPKGQRKFQKMECGEMEEPPKCEKFHAVVECRKTDRKLGCKKPKIPVPVYKCD